jgi:hypothetical protein
VIRRIARQTMAIRVAAGAPCFLDQLAQRDRRAAGLRGEPIPVPWQQRDFTGDDAQFRPPTSARCCRIWRLRRVGRLRQPGDDVGIAAAQVEVDGAAGCVVENQDRSRGPVSKFLDRQRHHAQRPSREAVLALEGGEV